MAYLTYTCGRDGPLLQHCLAGIRRVAPPGSVITVVVNERDPLDDAVVSQLAADGVMVRWFGQGGERLNGLPFVTQHGRHLAEAAAADPSCLYVAKVNCDVLLLRDTTAHLRATERFAALGTAGEGWRAMWGGYYLVHRRAAEALGQVNMAMLAQQLKHAYGFLLPLDEVFEDEFVGKALQWLFGEDQVYFRPPGPWVEGWFDAFHFDGRDAPYDFEVKGLFFDAVEFGRRRELASLPAEAVRRRQAEAMGEMLARLEQGRWAQWRPEPLAHRLAAVLG